MNHLQISTDPTLLGADLLPESLTTSPSVSTFLPEEDASTCLLLPETPSPPLDFSHPLTPSMGNPGDNLPCDSVTGGDDPAAETSSSSGSSGIGMVGPVGAAAGNLFSHNTYQHLRKKSDVAKAGQDGSMHHAAILGIAVTKDMPGFVHWNWPLIRKCTFFAFLAVIVAMVGIVVAMIATLPKFCNPDTAWYKGSVFYEVFPASFQDTNEDGLGDIRGLIGRAEYFKSLGIGAVRLNSIFPSKHYPDHFQEITTLTDVDEVLGKVEDIQKLAATLHERNISLVLDLPIYPFLDRLSRSTIDLDRLPNRTDGDMVTSEFLRLSRSVEARSDGTIVSDVVRFWLTRTGVDGFYVKGLEHFAEDPLLVENVKEWKYLLGPERVLIVGQKLVEKLPESVVHDVLSQVDLVDVYLDVSNGTDGIGKTVQDAIKGRLLRGEDHPWIHWSLGSVSERRMTSGLSPNATLAATLMELTLPGTPSIFYGDEISLEEVHDPKGEHGDSQHLHHLATMVWDGSQNQFTSRASLPWMPRSASASLHHLDYVIEAIALRKRSPSIYLNAVVKEGKRLPNADVKSNQNEILVVQRWYPRRHSFATIANLGQKRVSLDLTAMFYSGEIVAGSSLKHERVYFDHFEINPLETIVVKLHK
ncbi:neutral and basic amino acid transport protein rBAT-like [Anopheles ziemanni]|uniref:neutral and basic amino acid transport protein rBAT-like n=1 Tax=Anopheles coustani TaxID=139045 RepID=UPI0026596474|nr:neutral and basic amino acid transport protein rBAT-like [Anopheles coustani]XP_058167517.1 neutral and basic amino acid transport protein rBAT-like [Anopheles ziemanni]